MADMELNNFKAQLVGGGARPNLFRVVMGFPTFAGIGGETRKMSYMCKAASLPGSTLSSVPLPYRGRQLKIAGDRTFEPWTLTVINDTDFQIRNAFERWSNGINEHSSNKGLRNPEDYQIDGVVEQLDRDGTVLKTYTIVGAFPTEVSPIDLSNDSADTIEEFTVTLEYQYWNATTTS